MKDIRECFSNSKSITKYINENVSYQEPVNEGLRDILKAIKTKFKKAFEYLKGIVVKAGSYFVTVDTNGNVEPCISPLTAGQAFKDGLINKSNTLVILDKAGSKIVGLNTKIDDAKKLYGSGNSIKYWESLINEAEERGLANVNEVKMHTDDPQAKYNIICDDAELKNEIKMVLKHKSLAKLMIWGAPGIGKTAILMNVLDEMKADFPDYRIIIKTLSEETPDNFTLPKYVEVDGQEKATDIPKTWLPVYKPTGDPKMDAEYDAKCGSGLLFVDELSRATPQVLNVVLPLVNEGMFNGYKLGSGWTIIVASNRAEDETSGQSNIGNALANRFAQVYYEPTVHSWRKWADQQNFISPLLLQWLSMPESENMSGGKFYYMDPNEDMDSADPTKLMCTPRSWTNAMRDLALYSHTGSLEGFTIFDIPTRTLCRVLNKYVPADAIDSFLAFLEVIKSIGDFDSAVYSVWNDGGKSFKISKKDLNKVTLPVAQLICSAHADALPSEKEFENLCEWLIAQNSDQLTSYVLDVFKNVFMGSLKEDVRDGAFMIAAAMKKEKDPARIKLFSRTYAPYCNAWGLDMESLPDYSASIRKLGAKYKAAFKAAVVDGHTDALG